MRPPILPRWATAALALVVAACGGGPILAVPPVERPTSAPAPTPSVRPEHPAPIILPRDDGPHDRLTEWWYYTGHLSDEIGGRWGFEFVVFRAERGSLPVSWASHLAVTDETGGRFLYGQRSEFGKQVDMSPTGARGPTGFDLAVSGAATGGTGGQPWRMSGMEGVDRLVAGLDDGPSLDLALEANKAPVFHDHDGWIDFGPGGGSYYYSRTQMTARGSLELGGRRLAVDGVAWFDHQWGDFIAVGGGWDWFAINLDDGTDLTFSLVRDREGGLPLVYGTLVGADGRSRHLPREAFTVSVTGHWTSLATQATYPAGWLIEVPGERLEVELSPTVADQELDTRGTTGVVYWEGSQRVHAIRDGLSLGGQAYVELTGYAG